jgi:hypothetical protein
MKQMTSNERVIAIGGTLLLLFAMALSVVAYFITRS